MGYRGAQANYDKWVLLLNRVNRHKHPLTVQPFYITACNRKEWLIRKDLEKHLNI